MSATRSSVVTWIRRVWITSGLVFTLWIVWSMQAHGVPTHLTESTAAVRVEPISHGVVFDPVVDVQPLPVVFLPGGGVDPDAYIPLLRGLAEHGHVVGLVQLPWRMAFSEAAQEEVWTRVTDVSTRWPASRFVLAGHSRGAALAARFASQHNEQLAGLVLIGTTHPKTGDLSRLSLPVLKIAGTQDCVAPLADVQEHAFRLSAHTAWETIEGANHAQFGYYGSQLGDCAATITREDQHRHVITRVDAWLRSIGVGR